MKTEPRPSGRTIVLELVREMEDRLYPLFYRVLPPRAYHVYLHPDDYREIETVAPVITADAQRALTERVDTLNRRPRWQRLVLGKQQPIESPSAGWDIAIHPDANSELARGQIGIVSRLSVAARPTFEGGTPTTRIARTVVTGALRRTTTSEEAPPVPQAVPSPATVTAARGFAQLAYVDEQGPHTFVMRKDVVSVGRGGSAHWVDVQVTTGPRVSREHCRIRRGADGRFFLQDLSTWGTSVNGQRVKSFVQTSPAGEIAETGQEHELPRDARIQLADALQIEFRTIDSQ